MWAVARVYCFRFRMSRTSLIASQATHTHKKPNPKPTHFSILSLLP